MQTVSNNVWNVSILPGSYTDFLSIWAVNFVNFPCNRDECTAMFSPFMVKWFFNEFLLKHFMVVHLICTCAAVRTKSADMSLNGLNYECVLKRSGLACHLLLRRDDRCSQHEKSLLLCFQKLRWRPFNKYFEFSFGGLMKIMKNCIVLLFRWWHINGEEL